MQALIFVNFQDLPTGCESANHNKRVDEEVVSSSQEAKEKEKQEDVVMSKPDGEVRNQHRVYFYVMSKLNTEFSSGLITS